MKHLFLKGVALLIALCSVAVFSACSEKAATESKTFDKAALVSDLSAMSFWNEAKEPSQADLADIYEMDPSLFADSILLVDQEYNLCMLVIPAEGKSNDVKNMMAKSLDNLAQQLELYQPQQCQQVRERVETMRGEYLVYLATPENDAVLEKITTAIEG